jgi:nucleoside-diphosphate-sugar epimerase
MRYSERYLSDLHLIRHAVPEVQKLQGKKILISGAGGLICSALVDALLSWDMNIQVFAAGRNVEKLRRRFCFWEKTDNLKIIQWDVSEPLDISENIDFLIHGAAYANPEAYGTKPVETMLSNFLGTENMLRYICRQGIGRGMYISSSEVYGTKPDNTAYGEGDYGVVDILDPRSCYPSSKRAAETLCASYHKEYGVDVVIVRPGHVYGPTAAQEDNRASSQFPRDVLLGKNIVMKSSGSQLRSYCYVLDCVSAMLTVLIGGNSGKAYNISNKNSVVTIRQMAEAFASAAGRQVVFEDPTHAEAAAFNKMSHSDLDAAALEGLGWQAMFDLETGVEATLDSMN